MHLFDWLGRNKPPQAAAPPPVSPAEPAPVPAPIGPDELRRMLFDAVAAGDTERLTCLCRQHRDDLLARAGDWMKPPDALRSNPDALLWYGEGVRAVARFCADTLDRPDLLRRIDELGTSTPGVH